VPDQLRCPNCQKENRINFTRLRGKEFNCPSCGATLKFSGRTLRLITLALLYLPLGAFLTLYLTALVTGLPIEQVMSMRGKEIPQIYVVTMSVYLIPVIVLSALGMYRRKLVVVQLKPVCGNCGSTIAIGGAKFCPRCGTSVSASSGHRAASIRQGITRTKTQKVLSNDVVSTCMVCGQELKVRDSLAWCPHCGGSAHRDHLLEYLHVHGQCPACSQHLDEKELSEQMSNPITQASSREARKKQA
jgi:predicted RNA-binding Zn-ribbon protein involved in translation (DUF1610 family)